jgi:hypothetical protein
MGTVTTEHGIRGLEMGTHPSSHSLLTNAEMYWTTHLLLWVQLNDFLFNSPHSQHGKKELF